MKTSLVMAIYNGELYLKEQLDSIKDQTKKLDEVIILDDCSTDDSYTTVKQYIQNNHLDNWVLIKNEKNLGYQKNFQKGLSIATGDVIFLGDQDDRWHLNKIEIMLKYMNDEKVLSLASSFNFMDNKGKIFEINLEKGKANNNLLHKEVIDEVTEVTLNSLLRTNFSQGCTMAIKKILVKEYLKLTSNSIPHDWALNILSSVHQGCFYLDMPLIDYRIHGNNTIGLDEIINSNIVEEKKRRVTERVNCTRSEVDIMSFAIELPLNSEQHELCQSRYNYLKKRLDYMQNKKILLMIIFFICGGYKKNGKLKTFLGDIISIIKNR